MFFRRRCGFSDRRTAERVLYVCRGVLYSYAASVEDPEARQIGYTCRSEVTVEGDVVEVTLHILERRTYRGRKSEVKRKTLSHVFRDGYAVSRKTQVG
ncbi:MAG: hypothetical protein IJV76_03405 [Clostridia bacterium]|nr:hypothetical protein [Clostridia bacterium]